MRKKTRARPDNDASSTSVGAIKTANAKVLKATLFQELDDFTRQSGCIEIAPGPREMHEVVEQFVAPLEGFVKRPRNKHGTTLPRDLLHLAVDGRVINSLCICIVGAKFRLRHRCNDQAHAVCVRELAVAP